MYVTIQKIHGKSKVYGYPKDVVTIKYNLGTTGISHEIPP